MAGLEEGYSPLAKIPIPCSRCDSVTLDDLLSAVPDTLTVDEVAELTGYLRKTILRYAQRKYIYAVNIMGKYYILKQSIINYLATDKAFGNTQKSEWHAKIIKSFLSK